MKQLTRIRNKTYIIKQRGRFSKEYLEKIQKFIQCYRSHPSKFIEEYYRIKLYPYQKVMIDSILSKKVRKGACVI